MVKHFRRELWNVGLMLLIFVLSYALQMVYCIRLITGRLFRGFTWCMVQQCAALVTDFMPLFAIMWLHRQSFKTIILQKQQSKSAKVK